MASEDVTGATQRELEALRDKYHEWKGDNPEVSFEEHFCLAKIPRQPDDYQGPDRYCQSQKTVELGSSTRCKHHGGNGDADNLHNLAHMKHGMTATQEHLVEDFSEKDQALYDWILEEWPKAYDINFDEDPAAKHDLHRLAVEIVRAERGRGFLIEEGEVREDPVRNAEGQIVVDSGGEVVTEKSQHYLSDMLKSQDNKITKMEKELGITRKEQLRQDSTNEAVNAIKSFAELGQAFIDSDSEDYDPEEHPWEQE